MSEPTLVDDDLDLPLEDLEIPLDAPASPEPRAQSPESAALAPLPLVEVLSADFPLPRLLKFCPDVRLRAALNQATRYALAVEVHGPEGLQRADVALAAVRASLKAIEAHFEDPKDLANKVHKRITSTIAEWCEDGEGAVKTIGRRIALEQTRLEQLAREARRKAQEEEDRKAREVARRLADEAAKQQAPAPVVEQMRKQAETATAPPVPQSAVAPAALRSSSVVKTWKARIAGTPADDDPLPAMADVSARQRVEVLKLLAAIIAAAAPLTCIDLNTSYLGQRAKADKSTLAIPGIEAFEDLGTRAKGARAK
jgi:hypothetical protein